MILLYVYEIFLRSSYSTKIHSQCSHPGFSLTPKRTFLRP